MENEILHVEEFMYQSIPSLTIRRATPMDSHVPTTREIRFSPNFLFTPGVGVLNWRNFLQFQKKNAETSRFVSKKLKAA